VKLLRRNRDHEVEALRLRVHPGTVLATCGHCGIRTDCPEGTEHTTVSALDGRVLSWTRCSSCASRDDAGTVAYLAYEYLAAEVSREVAALVAPPLFEALPEAHPDRPSSRAWRHVDERALAASIATAHRTVAEQTEARPCQWCGTNRKVEGAGFGQAGGRWSCPSCSWRFDRQFMTRDGRRDHAVRALAGVAQPSHGDGIGARLGLRWFHELTDEERAALPALRGPFHWVKHSQARRWARSFGLTPERAFSEPW
jgi:hypothetical protein